MNRQKKLIAILSIIFTCSMGQYALSVTPSPLKKDLIELRTYTFKTNQQRDRFSDFMGTTMLPALKRLNIGPVGIFTEVDTQKKHIYLLLSYKTVNGVLTTNDLLLADKVYIQAAGDKLTRDKKNAMFLRYTSRLMIAFDDCKTIEQPVSSKTRLLQLRTYEGPSPVLAKRKVEMFNRGGEIALFRETGLNPVFFGETIIGDKMPNLTYMIGFENKKALDKSWKTFFSHPKWKKMSKDPYYKGTVSNVTNIILKPTQHSEI